MIVTVPAVLFLGGLTWLMIRSRTIRALESFIVGGFGFFLASTGLGAALAAFLLTLLHLHGATGPTTPSQTPVPAPVSTSVTVTPRGVLL